VETDQPTHHKFSGSLVKMSKVKERVKCGLCSSQLSSRKSLYNHMQYMHSDQSNMDKFHCLLCDYTPRNQVNLDKHILCVHLGVKKWKCELCEFVAGRAGQLKMHVQRCHAKEKNIKCEECDYPRTARVEKDWTRTLRHYARRPISAHFTSMTVLPY
jgi:hypothetical protein